MKLEKEKIIIRVGGGYLTIDDFIEQYCEEGKKQQAAGWLQGLQSKNNKGFHTFYLPKNEGSKTATTEQSQQQREQQEEEPFGVGEMSYERCSDN